MLPAKAVTCGQEGRFLIPLPATYSYPDICTAARIMTPADYGIRYPSDRKVGIIFYLESSPRMRLYDIVHRKTKH